MPLPSCITKYPSKASSAATPKMAPTKPDSAVSVNVSAMIWTTMILGVAPRARRTPSSSVRSLMVMSMMFMMPITPAKRASPPNTKDTQRKAPKTVSISWCSSAMLQWPKARLSWGWIPFWALNNLSTSAMAVSPCTSSRINKLSHPTSSPLWKAWLKVVNGTNRLFSLSSASSPVCWLRYTPTTVKFTPDTWIVWPKTSSFLSKSNCRTRFPMTATFLRSSKSFSLT